MKYFLLAILLLAHPSHADELQDRIKSAVKAYADITPGYPDIGIGWAQTFVDDAVKIANPAEVITTDQIGAWLVRNQPIDNDPEQRKLRVQWLADAFKAVMGVNTVYSTAFPVQQISVADLKLRINQAVDDIMPGMSSEELAIETERVGRSLAEDMAERAAKREARRLGATWDRSE